MKYVIRGFEITENALDCRFEFIVPSFDDVVEVLARVTLDYDVVKILPMEV